MMTSEQEEQANRIRTKVGEWAKNKIIDFRKAWKIVYDEYQERTGKSVWAGPKHASGLDNVAYQGNLDILEAIVDELITPLP
jgi:dihydroorotase-like cyclic amidohydrolase